MTLFARVIKSMALHDTILNFPAGVCISGARLSLKNAVGVQTSAFSFARQVQVFSGQGWSVELDFIDMTREEASILEAFLLSLRGRAGRFRIGDPFHSLPLGVSKGKPALLLEAVVGEEVIHTAGWIPNVLGQLKANDKIQIGDAFYSVLQDVNSDANGYASVSIAPSIRSAHAINSPIITRNARGVFSLVDDSSFSRNRLQWHNTSLIAVEAF